MHGITNLTAISLQQASYYLPQPPAKVVNAANGMNSHTGISLGVPRTQYTRIILLFPVQSKPGLSLKMHTFPHSCECEGDHAALVLDSPMQAIP